MSSPSLIPDQDPSCLSNVGGLPLSQLMALLRLHERTDELARAVLAKLMAGTARDGAHDQDALVTAGLAFRTRSGSTNLTYIGYCKAVTLTLVLAQILGVKRPRFARPRRGGFGFSQAGNW